MGARPFLALVAISALLAPLAAACTDPEPDRQPALSTQQLRTSVLVTGAVASRGDDVSVSQGSDTGESVAERTLTFDSHDEATDAFVQLAGAKPSIRWDTLTCSDALLLRGSERIGGTWAMAEISLDGASSVLTVRVASPTEGGSGEPDASEVEVFGADCDPEVLSEVGA